jgi:hypothetical protein
MVHSPSSVILSVTEGGAMNLLYLSFNTGATRRSAKTVAEGSQSIPP